MTPTPRRVVYDCNIFFQSLVSKSGPARRCTELTERGRVNLFVSDFVFGEIRDLAARPSIAQRFSLDSQIVEAFLTDILARSTKLTDVPELFRHPIDAKDSHYVNLALAANAQLIVSRDNHLLDLMDVARSHAREFQARFPRLRVVTPVALLQELDAEWRAKAEPPS